DRGVIEGRGREAVQDQQRFVLLGPDRGHVDGEDLGAEQFAMLPDGLPPDGRHDRHMPASLLTTGASVSHASDSIDQYEIPYSARRHSSSSAISSRVPIRAIGTWSASAGSRPKAGAI